MVRFPHKLVFRIDQPATQDANGNWVPGTLGTEQTILCRAQPNIRASYLINEQDGSRIDYSCTIYVAKNSTIIPTGTEVKVLLGNVEMYSGEVKRFHPGQLHSRLWI